MVSSEFWSCGLDVCLAVELVSRLRKGDDTSVPSLGELWLAPGVAQGYWTAAGGGGAVTEGRGWVWEEGEAAPSSEPRTPSRGRRCC